MRQLTLFTFVILAFLALLSCEEENNQPVAIYTGQRFVSLPADSTGVDFVNRVPENQQLNVLTYQYLHNGGGVAVGDINNDGLDDIYFTANYGPNKLYLNEGNLKFREIGREAGVGGEIGWSTGVTMVDINNDGLLDIYVCRSGNVDPDQRRNSLFLNLGGLRFRESAQQYNLHDPSYSTQSYFMDHDRDGDLDMLLVNHPIFSLAASTDNPETNQYTQDKLYRNDNGKFVDITDQSGMVKTPRGFGLSASIADFNNDGWPDFYVANDYIERDFLYMNNAGNGNTAFTEVLTSNPAVNGVPAMRHTSNFSMGSDAGDMDGDGQMDLMVVDMVAEDNYRIKTNMSGMSQENFESAVERGFHYQYMMNTLQLNNGNGTFSEVAQKAGVSSTDWSWAPLWADFDLDGKQDLFIANGLRKEARNNDFIKVKFKLLKDLEQKKAPPMQVLKQILDSMPVNPIQNYVYQNNGDLNMTDRSDDWGLTEKTFSNGAAYADLDNDGDLEIIVNNIDQPALIYENKSSQMNGNWLAVQLKGSEKNKNGIGARLTLTTDQGIQVKEQYLSRGYQSGVSPVVHFGIAGDDEIEQLEIRWPDGKLQMINDVKRNQRLVVDYKPTGKFELVKRQEALLVEVDQGILPLEHKENDYNDFAAEILLPHRMSVNGPAIATGDYDGDGLEDIFMAGSREQPAQLAIQGDGGEYSIKSIKLNLLSVDQVHAASFDLDGDGDLDIYVATGGHEAMGADLYDYVLVNDGTGNFNQKIDIPISSNAGSLAIADYDADGDMDVLVGGRAKSKSYPNPDRSYLLRNDDGKLIDVTTDLIPEVEYSGMLNAAQFADLNGDGKLDLVTAGEWTAPTVYLQDENRFTKTAFTGLDKHTGWWFSLAAGDFDNDGDMDLVAGNLGENYKYQASPEKTFDLYYDDFDNTGTGDIVLTYESEQGRVPLRGRECTSQQMPFVKEKFGTYDAFAKANLEEILPEDKLETATVLKATTFANMYFENQGDGSFTGRKLPPMAQLSSLNSILSMDVNNDGHLDIVAAGNLYESEVETPRNDAGNGIILLGNVKGDFSNVNAAESGFFAPYNVKNMVKTSYKDKPAILVGNNDGKVQFFRMAGSN